MDEKWLLWESFSGGDLFGEAFSGRAWPQKKFLKSQNQVLFNGFILLFYVHIWN